MGNNFVFAPFGFFWGWIILILLVFCVEIFQYYFEDRYDLVRFVKLVQQAGLYVHLRIGPYVCAEWNFG